jgi:hypothetical protein
MKKLLALAIAFGMFAATTPALAGTFGLCRAPSGALRWDYSPTNNVYVLIGKCAAHGDQYVAFCYAAGTTYGGGTVYRTVSYVAAAVAVNYCPIPKL